MAKKPSAQVTQLARDLDLPWEQVCDMVVALKKEAGVTCRVAVARIRRWTQLGSEMQSALD